MACEHRCARAGSAYLDWKFGDAPLGDAAKNFARLDRNAFFLARNIRDDVLDDIERGQVAAGARDSLHRGDDRRVDAETVVERLERYGQPGRGAVGERRDIALPSAPPPLLGDDRDMVEVDAGDHEGTSGSIRYGRAVLIVGTCLA